MQNLSSSEIDKIGGGYLHLTDVDAFLKLNNNFKGGILHVTPNPPVRKERNFPTSPALLD
ncbi:hypothetical protein [Massilia sp.]|uniref:hypothetical protein n=1 Tax=Massilia sp. TaxID=1882437 RepID=UPI00391B6DE1